MLLSIIVPVYNEEKLVEASLEKLAGVKFSVKTEIIVVDDGSTDRSLEVVKEFAKSRKNFTVVANAHGGKGSALRAGIKRAKGGIITFHDADAEYDPNDLRFLLDGLLKSGKNYVVYGSRFMKKQTNWAIPLHYIGNRFLSLFVTLLYLKRIDDMETCYKMFYAEALDGIELESSGFDIEPEITAKFLNKGLKIKEFPISYAPRTFKEGKKINYRDGIAALSTIIRCRFF